MKHTRTFKYTAKPSLENLETIAQEVDDLHAACEGFELSEKERQRILARKAALRTFTKVQFAPFLLREANKEVLPIKIRSRYMELLKRISTILDEALA